MSKSKKLKLETVEYANCSAIFCGNIYSTTINSKPDLIYHPFPQDKIYFEKWKEFCQPSDSQYRLTFICSDHFNLDDYYIDQYGYKKLKFNAVPTVIIQKDGIKQNEIDIIDIHNSPEGSQNYDSFYVYELDESATDQLCDQDNIEELNNLKSEDDETEDETEDLDEMMFEVIEQPIDGQDCPDHFESEQTITDHKIKSKMLYEEAKTALKLAFSIKPPMPPKRSNEDIFGTNIADQLMKITNEKIYNDTIWAMQEALQKGIDKIRKRAKNIIEEDNELLVSIDENNHKNEERGKNDDIIEDIIVLDSSEENENQQNENDQEEITIPQNDAKVDVYTENKDDFTSKISDAIENNVSNNTPPQRGLSTTVPILNKESSEKSSLPQTSTTFSNSAVKGGSLKINSNSTENYIRNKEPTFSVLNNSEKTSIFPKVTLQPREMRPIITLTQNNSDILLPPHLQNNQSKVQNLHDICQTSNDAQNSNIPTNSTLNTLPSNVTVPIILICPPTANPAFIAPNTSSSDNNIPSENPNPFITFAVNPQKTAIQTNTESSQRTTPNFTQDILRAVSNILAASAANPKP